ncbi:DUF3303 domain-containing protein [Chloroflexota bacterium]
MLHMNILTWAPDKRDAVIERVKKIGMEHEGIKVIDTWIDINGGRCFQLSEEPADLKSDLKANFAWNDLLHIETIPIMKGEEFLQLLDSIK